MTLDDRAGSGVERFAAALPLWIVLVANPLGIFRFVADPTLLRWWLAAVAILVAMTLSRALRRRMTDRWRDLLPPLGVVLATVLHLAAGAPRPESTRFIALVIVGVACFAYFRAVDDESQRFGLRLMTLSASVLGLYAIAQALGFDFFHYPSESWMYRVVTTLGHRNFTAVFLLVSLFVALDLREGAARAATGASAAAGSSAVERGATVALALTYLGLLATGSRFPILMASVGLLVAARRHRAARIIAAALGAMLALWLALIVARGEVGKVLTRTETFAIRADLYPAVGALALERPLLGQGVGSFSHRISAELAGRRIERSPDLVFLHAHNLPAELLIELGVVGLLCAAWLPARALLAALRRRSGRTDWLVWALCGWLVTNLYDVNFFTYAGWVSFWPILGVVASRYGSAGSSSGAPAKAALAPVVALFAGLLSVAVLLLPLVVSDHKARRALLAADLGLFDQERSFWQEAESFAPLPLEHRYRAAVSRLSPGGPAQEGVTLLEEIERDAPGFSAVRFNLAMGLARLGRYRDALEWIDRHLAAYPRDPQAIEARVALLNRSVGLESLVPDRP